jgi:cobalt-zinc-cadmium efflux system outer membrane protein
MADEKRIPSRDCTLVRTLPALAAAALLAGCATAPRPQMAGTRAGIAPAVADARVRELAAAPLNADACVEIAMLESPRIATELARLGLARADLIELSRLSNPTLSLVRIRGDGQQMRTTGLSQSISDLVLLAARRKLGEGELVRARTQLTALAVDLAADVQAAWFEAVAASQSAAMRGEAARAAQASAQLMQRYFAAGNVGEQEVALAQVAASQARIAASRGAAAARDARWKLQQSMGLAGAPSWTLTDAMHEPARDAEAADDADALVALARARRADLAAQRAEVGLLGDALALARRWRWLGSVELGVERDSEPDGARLQGPTIALALPIFNQGEAGIARAEARRDLAIAALHEIELGVERDVRSGIEHLASTRAIVEEFRGIMLPQAQLALQRQQERQNFMLIGVFELLAVRQQQADAQVGYVESLRDYWLARVELARATGGTLPERAITIPEKPR